MKVKDLAEQLNDIYTEAVKRNIDIENFTVAITNWSPESTLMVNVKDRTVEIL